MDFLRASWNFENCFIVDAEDRRGGLVLLWKSEVKLEILSFNKYHIDAIIGDS